MKYYIVNAFSKKAFGGNPAAVVFVDEFIEKDIMVKIAAEFRYSETVFIKASGENNFNFRYFTPVMEVDLCGHATIAGIAALKKAKIISEFKKNIYVKTLAGEICINFKGDTIYMDMASPKLISVLDKCEKEELYRIFNTKENDKEARIISTGLPDIIMPLRNIDELNNLSIDMKHLKEFSKNLNVTGVHAFCEEEGEYHCRNFAPLYGIDEEAATGTANGALSYYLYLDNEIRLNQEISFIQGEKMQRRSIVKSIIEKRDVISIRIGGDAIIIAEGKIINS